MCGVIPGLRGEAWGTRVELRGCFPFAPLKGQDYGVKQQVRKQIPCGNDNKKSYLPV